MAQKIQFYVSTIRSYVLSIGMIGIESITILTYISLFTLLYMYRKYIEMDEQKK